MLAPHDVQGVDVAVEIFRCPVDRCAQIDMSSELAAVHAAEHADPAWVAQDAEWRRIAQENYRVWKQKRGKQ